MYAQRFSHRVSYSSLAWIAATAGILSSTTQATAQLVDVKQQARASREKLVSEIASVDSDRLRAKLINSTENRDLARWYAGEMQLQDRWMPLEEAQTEAAGEENWQEYRELRHQASNTLRDHESLARWCEKHELADLSRMHWLAVLRFDRSHRAALSALQPNQTQASAKEQLAAQKKRRREQEKQARKIQAKVEKLKRQFDKGPAEQKQAAKAQLLAIDDPQAVRPLVKEFAAQEKEEQKLTERGTLLMQVLGGIDSSAAVETLANAAVFAEEPETRYEARKQLDEKPLEETVPLLVSGLQMPVSVSVNVSQSGSSVVRNFTYEQEQADGSDATGNNYDYQTIAGPRYQSVPMYRNISYVGPERLPDRVVRTPITEGHGRALVPYGITRTEYGCGRSHTWVLGTRYRYEYADEYTEERVISGGTRPGYATGEYVGDSIVETTNFEARMQNAKQQALAATNQVRDRLEQHNQQIGKNNEKIAEVLTQLTGAHLPPDPKTWWNWWGEYLQANPELVSVGAQSKLNAALLNLQQRGLARGTKVWTRTGKRAIETIAPGDYVLSQHPKTGELAYRLVLNIAVPKLIAVSKLDLDETELHLAEGHIVWSTGTGWRSVSKLKAGNSLHGVRSESVLSHMNEAFEIESFDLIVDEFHTLFVGEAGVLVHDGTAIKPTAAALPGFSPAAVASAVELAAK